MDTVDCAFGVCPQPYYLPETYMGSAPKCSGSKHKIRQPGNANRPIGKGHVWSMFLEYVAGRISAANLSDCFRHDPLVCQCGDWRSQGKNCLSTSFLPPPVIPAFPRHPCIPPSSLPFHVIPAKAGILTRAVIYKSRTIVVNYAGKPFKVRAIFLFVLQSLVWIRAICKARRSYPG